MLKMNEVFVLKEGYAYTTESGELGRGYLWVISELTAKLTTILNLFNVIIRQVISSHCSLSVCISAMEPVICFPISVVQ